MMATKKKTTSFQEPEKEVPEKLKEGSTDSPVQVNGVYENKQVGMTRYKDSEEDDNSGIKSPTEYKETDDETIKSNNSSVIRPPLLRKDTFSMQAARSLSFRASSRGLSLQGDEYDANGWLVYTRTTGEIQNKQRVQKVRVESSVTFIPDKAFYGCANLTVIQMPNDDDSRLVSIGQFAFYECTSLHTVQLPNSIKDIGEYAFSGCGQLTTIQLPDNLTTVQEGVFSDCPQLTTIFVPDSITSIGLYAFYGCANLISILLPDSVMLIGEEAMEGCTLITSLCDKTMTLKKWLRHRYDTYPLHRLCYLPGHTDLEVLVFKKHIDTLDEAKMNPLHILCLNPYANLDVVSTMDMIHALVANSDNKAALLSAQDVSGRTPLHYACLNPFVGLPMLKAMVESNPSKAFLSIADKNYKTPTAVAIDSHRRTEINQWLYRYQPVEARDLSLDTVQADRIIRDLASNYITELTDNTNGKYRDITTSFPPEDQHGWVKFVSQLFDVELVQRIVEYIGACERNVVKALANAQDFQGRRAIHCAVSGIKQALQTSLLFCGRYDIESRPRYSTIREKVYFGKDAKGGGLRGTSVALTFVSDKDLFERQQRYRFRAARRERLDSKYVTSVLAVYNGDLEKSVAVEAKKNEFPQYCIVTEQFECNLLEAILNENITSDVVNVRSLLFQLAFSLKHLHDKGLVHGNLKARNIVRHRDENGVVRWKLTGFEAATLVGQMISPESVYTAYAPPEMIEKGREGSVVEIPARPSVDVWSFGLILYMLETNKLHLLAEFIDVNDNLDKAGLKKMAAWDSSDVKERLGIIPSGPVKDLLAKILHKKPEKRPTMQEILKDDFFASERRLEELRKMCEAAQSFGNEANVDEIQKEMDKCRQGVQKEQSGGGEGPSEKRGSFRALYRVVLGGKKTPRRPSMQNSQEIEHVRQSFSFADKATSSCGNEQQQQQRVRRQRRASLGSLESNSDLSWAINGTTPTRKVRRTSLGGSSPPEPPPSPGKKNVSPRNAPVVVNPTPKASPTSKSALSSSIPDPIIAPTSPTSRRWGRRRRRNSIF